MQTAKGKAKSDGEQNRSRETGSEDARSGQLIAPGQDTKTPADAENVENCQSVLIEPNGRTAIKLIDELEPQTGRRRGSGAELRAGERGALVIIVGGMGSRIDSNMSVACSWQAFNLLRTLAQSQLLSIYKILARNRPKHVHMFRLVFRRLMSVPRSQAVGHIGHIARPDVTTNGVYFASQCHFNTILMGLSDLRVIFSIFRLHSPMDTAAKAITETMGFYF